MIWRPRYSWRTLLIVTIVAGVVIGLYVRSRWRRGLEEDFVRSVYARDAAAVREYLDIDPDIARRAVAEDGNTSLHYAAFRPEPEVLKLLLDSGIDVNVRNENRDTPLHLAANMEWVEGARLLLDAGADVNAIDGLGMAPLHWSHNVALCQLLIEHGADLEITDQYGRTALARAMEGGRTELAELLRKHGAKEPTP